MTTIINAVSGTGLTQTADGSGIVKLQSNGTTTNALAWVNFDGTLTTPITPRANYNCSSVTKNGTGDYTLNFTNTLSDANYAPAMMCQYATDAGSVNGHMAEISRKTAPTTSALRVETMSVGGGITQRDLARINIIVFGN